MISRLAEYMTKLLEHVQGSTEILFATDEPPDDGSASITMWDASTSRFFLVDVGHQIDAKYCDQRRRADSILKRFDVSFVRIVAFQTRQEFAQYGCWIPHETVLWFASEPEHHFDLGGRRLMGPAG